MTKIIVTGANGYIGRHVVKELIKQNIDFLAVDISTDTLPDNINKMNCDIFNEKNLFDKFGKPDILLHLAWRDGFVHNSKKHFEDLSSHFNFLTSMIDNGIKQVCILGTMHEVGYFEGKIDENTPTNPLSQYGIAKNALRKSIELYCNGKDTVYQWIRAFYIYSNDEKGNSIFSKLVQSHLNAKKDFPFTSGKNKYDFISVEELSKQIVAVINQNKINGIINCCSGKPISLGEKVEQFIKENELNIKLNYNVYPDRKYDSPIIYGDNSKISKIMEEL